MTVYNHSLSSLSSLSSLYSSVHHRFTGPIGFANIQHVGTDGEDGSRYMIGWADNVQVR